MEVIIYEKIYENYSYFIILIILSIGGYVLVNKYGAMYIVNINWKTQFNVHCKILYSYTTPTYNSDGIRYEVLQYNKNKIIIDDMDWIAEKNADFEIRMIHVMESVKNDYNEIFNEYYPNFISYKYINKTYKNNDLYAVFDVLENKIYILEDCK
jgi:hypothetical protein